MHASVFVFVFVLVLAGCTGATEGTGPATTTTSTTAPTTTASVEATTTMALPQQATTVTAEGLFVDSGNRVLVIEPESPSHVVVALHGHPGSPESLERLGQLLAEHGAAVVIPKINTSPSDMGTQAIEAACALSHAARSYPDLPLVIVGHSMGGLLTGQYVASPGLLADPTQCVGPYVAAQPVGVLLLDGPVWLKGYYEATGFGDPNDPSVAIYDPVAIAEPSPDLQVHYFYSTELPEFTPILTEQFDTAMGVTGAVTYLDTGHSGLISTNFDGYAAAVDDILNNL